ncbi:CDP-diacylglycerol--glycerol-3-phosphate 3-phosphatidyltransferase [Idiomarina baltica]|jgi:CDP-diacylglycerol--glycerol-3-phosphate 3-phosphatidyltransferase|uniref:CDP-diacylglycerol--glycerol-3-phosphate 3-phosphatidyltransferase n=4 Tax=Idiomarina TaxID=135575 RepID=A0A348WQK7_9GAMM|nr:CDP-diacylglycerol--glycerol-3-phosphate 3-phosphatidyltransferase [Idiomarina baltica]EAQ31782.1 Phosphatidylglycerophosphate synthase [Idiomarina baltica OS145]MBR37485.1 CDP-diacylglycerol--glycerol-3-phosphate 3-phosphatidyltransferase [Idiomarina sp.]HAE90610.1 CDP-diacylglycerol--glycerol-3-phosphate 3-phosphatidyltransferase [Idiomarina sp.]HAR56819.1 CDP-diacylglycerol--glycerol-3-phosphate 3-phosphatidyltransferase [Idiomarina baltica]|tara:strand:- start:15 stop:563 length:549 start_codon:yes stop_codon:yes gene_type:complete
MKWNIPNILTSFRILLIPVFLIVFYLPFEDARFWSAFIFWLAAITDALDGWIARQFNQFTEFGAFLDPVADKAMVIAALVVLVEDYNAWYITVPALTMICRELIVSALREWMAQRGNRDKVAVSNLGKLKTIAQMVALIGLLWDANIWTFWISIVLFFTAFVLTLWSMWEYLRAAGSQLTRN